MLSTILVISAILIVIYYFAIRPLQFWKNLGVSQTPLLETFLFNFFGLFHVRDVTDFIQSFYNEFPDSRYCGIYLFHLKFLVVRDTELIKQILIRDFEHFAEHRALSPAECDPLFGKNLFASKSTRWRHLRPILSPSFTSSKMKTMFILMKDCSKKFVQHFEKKNQDLITVEMKDVFSRFANDVIATTAFGVEVDSLENPENEFYRLGNKTTDLNSFSKQLIFIANAVSPFLSKLLKIRFFENDVRTFFSNLIIETIKERREKGIIRPDMIHLLMEAQKIGEDKINCTTADNTRGSSSEKEKYSMKLSDVDIIAQALGFFFAGFDSVSTTMCFLAHELAVNPNVQKNLRQEIRETSANCNGKLTYDSLMNMKYMDMVLSEVLRRWPAQVGFERVCTKPYTIEPVLPGEKPVHLEKGVGILIPTFGIQNDPELFPNPKRFYPERFSEENRKNDILTFGMGPRNCIGSRFAMLEIKVIFFHIISRFEIIPVEKTTIPLLLTKFQMGSKKGFWLGLKRLNY